MSTPSSSFRSHIKDFLLTLVIAVSLIGVYHILDTEFISVGMNEASPEESLTVEVPQKIYRFGYDMDQVHIKSDIIRHNQFLGDILNANGVGFATIAELESTAKQVYSVRKIRAGRRYHIIQEDSCKSGCKAFIYEPDPLRYVVYSFEDSVTVEVVDKKFEICQEIASGVIESSLWNAMVDQDINLGVIDLMEDALASSVSFYHTKVGDRFKVVYERKYIDGEPIALGRLLGAYYENDNGKHYSVYFENENYGGFYDEEGRPTKKSFLLSPIRAGRISSRYNLRRLHPIKRRRIPHRGTDYAAPYGTPIRAVADGVVIAARYTKNNGKYVKIKHDGTYTTQYLHMQKYGKGMRVGTAVVQGQTIGYVGSTGLATGPHVCFRFWKNGNQVDHLRENFPPADPMPIEQLPLFYAQRDYIKMDLDNIPFEAPENQLANIPTL